MTLSRKQNCLLLAALGLLCCVWAVQIPLTRLRDVYELSPAVDEPVEVIPILVLGGFRGVVVDVLWIRAMARHEEKRFFELKTIYDIIANLQPNIPDVWIFQGWNMAYNIAHDMETKEGKWKWVRAGLKYVRRGLAKNPKSGDMRAELGHMYTHKFNHHVFPLDHVQHFRRELAKEGVDNFEQAAKWYREAVRLGLKVTNEPVLARAVAHTYSQAALFARKEKRWGDAIACFGKCLEEWQGYARTYPGEAHDVYVRACASVTSALASTHLDMALEAEAAGRADQALRHYQATVACYRRSAEASELPLLAHHQRRLRIALRKLGLVGGRRSPKTAP